MSVRRFLALGILVLVAMLAASIYAVTSYRAAARAGEEREASTARTITNFCKQTASNLDRYRGEVRQSLHQAPKKTRPLNQEAVSQYYWAVLLCTKNIRQKDEVGSVRGALGEVILGVRGNSEIDQLLARWEAILPSWRPASIRSTAPAPGGSGE